MYVRTVTRKNKRKPDVTYVQLAHNARDKQSGRVKAHILYNFGRADQLDLEAIKRLVHSLTQLLPDGANLSPAAKELLDLGASRSWGGAWVLRRLWERLGLPAALERALQARDFSAPVAWALFALVANRALAPSSKRAIETWAREDVVLGNPVELQTHHLYRAMDFLLEHEEAIQQEVFFATADLLNLEVDLLFFDTTSSYFEVEGRDEEGLRRWGHSKDHRPDLPQVVIGLAVTKEGIPVRSWVLPGNTQDVTTVEAVQRELAGWKLGRCVWVMDRGMASEDNKVVLQRAGGHYILGEKLRDGTSEHEAALSHPGRYRQVRDNLKVKEIRVGDGTKRRRYVVVYNPQQAERDRAQRQALLQRLEAELEALGNLSGQPHKKAVCALVSHRRLGRYLKQLKSGALRIDRSKLKAEERLDGKYLLSSSDPHLSAEEIALGYKQLQEVERAFRSLKQTLELRPMYHRKDERIRAHVTLCWLALLLVRILERQTGQSWEVLRRELERIHLVEVETQAGRILHRTGLSANHKRILKALGLKPPPQVPEVRLPPTQL